MPGNGLEQDGRIPHFFGEGADLVQGGGVGHQPVTGDPAIGGLQAHHPAQGGGLPDRAAGVGAQRGDAQVRGHRRGRAPGGTAGNIIPVPGVAGGAEGRVFRGGAHGELIHVDLAQKHRPGPAQPGADGGVIGGDEVRQDPGAAGGSETPGDHDVFEGQGDARQRRGLTPGQHGGGLLGHGPGPGFVHGDIGVELAVPRLDAGEHRLGHLHRRHLAPGQKRAPTG